MRAYAFTSRDGRVLMLLSTCYAILVGVNIWVFCINVDVPLQLYAVLGRSGCFPNYGEGVMAMRIGVSLFSNLYLCSADFPIVYHCTSIPFTHNHRQVDSMSSSLRP